MTKEKRAQSEIITTVLIILLVLATIVIVWAVVKNTVMSGTGQVKSATACIGINLEIKDAAKTPTSIDSIKVKRGVDSVGNLDAIKIIVENSEGIQTCVSDIITSEDLPSTLEEKILTLSPACNTLSSEETYTVKIAPKISGQQCAVSDEEEVGLAHVACSPGEIVYGAGCAIPLSSCDSGAPQINQDNKAYILSDSIASTGTCFTISANNIVLDGNGKTVDGDDSGTDYGIYASGRNNVTIKNFADVRDFNTGIYFASGTHNSIIQDVTATSNHGGGIYLTSSSNNVLSSITANSNSGAGIYLYLNSNNNQLSDITANSNQHGIYLSSSSNNNQLSNIAADSNSGVGIYLYLNSNNNELSGINADSNSYGIALYQSSNNNQLSGVNADSNSYGIYIFSQSIKNKITNVNMWNCSGAGNSCVYVYRAGSNQFENLYINSTIGSGKGIYLRGDIPTASFNVSNNFFKDILIENVVGDNVNIAQTAGNVLNNTFLNASYDVSKEAVSGSAGTVQLVRKWHYTAYVNNTGGNNIDGANITAYNQTGAYQFNLTTNSNGLTELAIITDYINNAGTKTYYSPYNIFAVKTGYTTLSQNWDATLKKNARQDFTLTSV